MIGRQETAPQPKRSSRRQLFVALIASGALLLSGCGNDEGEQEPTGTTSVGPVLAGERADGQYETSLVFFPDGSALSAVTNPKAAEEAFEGMKTHYSCPAGGPHLQIASNYAPEYGRGSGATQLIENSAICTDGRVTQSDFSPRELVVTTTSVAPTGN